jgi:hypothetical protein
MDTHQSPLQLNDPSLPPLVPVFNPNHHPISYLYLTHPILTVSEFQPQLLQDTAESPSVDLLQTYQTLTPKAQEQGQEQEEEE